MWEWILSIGAIVFLVVVITARRAGLPNMALPEGDATGISMISAAGYLLATLLPEKLRALEQQRLMPRLLLLQGPVASISNLERHLSEKCLHALLGMALSCLLCLLGNAAPGMIVCLPLGGLSLWFLSDRQLEVAYRERCRKLEQEFPGFVCQVALLTGAGLHVRQALHRIIRGTALETSILCREVDGVLSEIEGGMPEAQAWTELAERCRIREIASLCGILMQHARLGGAGLAQELRQMASDSWDARKHAARRLGEEASSKLMLPLAILFVAVLLVSVAPAFLSLSGAF